MFLFEPEHDYGNVEYKAHMNRLVGVKRHRYISQIKYRIMEGEGVAYYVIGVRDDGKVIGLSRSNVERSLQTFMKLIYALNYRIAQVLKCTYKHKRHFLIIKITADIDIYEDLNYFIT